MSNKSNNSMSNKSKDADRPYKEYAKQKSTGREVGEAVVESLLSTAWEFFTGWAQGKVKR